MTELYSFVCLFVRSFLSDCKNMHIVYWNVTLKKVNYFDDMWKTTTKISPIEIGFSYHNLEKKISYRIWNWFILSSKSFWLNTNRYNYTPVPYGINCTPVIDFFIASFDLIDYLFVEHY